MQRLLQKNRSRDEDGEVQYLAVLKRIRGAEFNEKRAARLKQLEIFIPQWHELAIIDSYLSIKSFTHPKNVLTFSTPVS